MTLVSQSAASSPSGLQRVEELWFEGDSLIIQAENSLYRVSKGVLAARSPVFKDMLSFPQPEDAEMMDGCPIVRLHDSAAALTCFLQAIFDSSYFECFPAKTTFDTIFGVLRLSHKYDVGFLRRKALVHLSYAFPTKLADYDNIAYETIFPGRTLVPTVLLAREVQALWILPVVFYKLCRSSHRIEDILNGVEYLGSRIELCADDKLTALEGSSSQREAVEDVMAFFHEPVDLPGCCTSVECLRRRLELFHTYKSELRFLTAPLDLIFKWDWGVIGDFICISCLPSCQAMHEEARIKFWNELPEMFGLPNWNELEKLKCDALA